MDDSRILGNSTYAERIRGMKKNRFRDSEAEKNYFIRSNPLIMTPNPNTYSGTNADGSVTPPIQLSSDFFEVTHGGYTVSYINGYYMYMEYDSYSESLISSGLIAGVDDPETSISKTSGTPLAKNEHLKLPIKVVTLDADVDTMAIDIPKPLGKKKLLVVPFKFNDHSDRPLPTVADLTVLMNSVNADVNICPTGSVKNYFLKNSFDRFELTSTVAPSWVSVPKNEAVYANNSRGETCEGLKMIVDALNALEATGFDFTPFDEDNNGVIDEISFFHSGYDAAFGGNKARILSHTWSLAAIPGCIHEGKWTSTKSKKSVIRYARFSSLWGTSGSEIGRIGVVVHELGHLFGLPDLYDYNRNLKPPALNSELIGVGVGNYCLMGTGNWGFDGQQRYPSHLSAWSKIKAEWLLQPIDITSPGTYIARQACTYPDAFKISKNFPQNEYLLIENRFNCEYDLKIPGPGLAIYHVDEKAKVYKGKINEYEGYPGQPGWPEGWPENGNHYTVALLQADGLYNLEKGNNKGDETDLFGATVTSIGPGGTSNGQIYPNTNAYQSGNIIDTCITIKNIGKPSAAVSFEVSFDCTKPVPAPKPKPVPRPVPLPKPKPVPRPVPLPKPKPVPRPVPLPKPKPAPTPSTVIFREDFLGSSLDSKNWVVEEGELDRTELGNTPIINGGIASLTFDTYGFKGTEIHTNKRYSRGSKGLEIEAKIKLVTPLPSGLVTSFYTWAENSSGSVDEIDVEILSKQLNQASDKALLLETYNDFHGDEKLPHYWSTSKSLSNLDVGTWHTFTIRWTPGRTYWLVDGVVVADSDKAQPNADSYIGLLFWAPDSDWPDAYDKNFQPVTKPASNRRYYFDIDYVEIRRLM